MLYVYYIYSSSKFYFIFVAFDERRRCIKWKIVMRRVFTLHTQAIQINQSNNTKHTFELEWPGMCVSFFRQLLTYPEEENHKFSTFCHFTVFIFHLILLMDTFFFCFHFSRTSTLKWSFFCAYSVSSFCYREITHEIMSYFSVFSRRISLNAKYIAMKLFGFVYQKPFHVSHETSEWERVINRHVSDVVMIVGI